MMLTHARMADLTQGAPDFSLLDTVSGRYMSLADLADYRALVIAFICNHCPFVQHMAGGLAAFARDYQARGVGLVAICANDTDAYPDDAPAKMTQAAAAWGFSFPYLFDETQDVATIYGAICTPDIYVFDAHRRLAYRGQFDASRPTTEHFQGNREPVTGADLRAACDAILDGRRPAKAVDTKGCVIKWRPGNTPMWTMASSETEA